VMHLFIKRKALFIATHRGTSSMLRCHQLRFLMAYQTSSLDVMHLHFN
jgi:hypothetical protein